MGCAGGLRLKRPGVGNTRGYLDQAAPTMGIGLGNREILIAGPKKQGHWGETSIGNGVDLTSKCETQKKREKKLGHRKKNHYSQRGSSRTRCWDLRGEMGGRQGKKRVGRERWSK